MAENKLDKLLRIEKKKLMMELEDGSSILNESIMIVDDDESVVKSLEFIFKDKYQVFSCYSGIEAVNIYKKHKDKISAILLDIKMDKKDGIEIYKELKKINQAIPIIFNTAYPGEYKPLDLLQELHPFGYIIKGTDPAILYESITSAIEYYNLIKDKDRLNEKLKEAVFDLKQLHKSSQNINSIDNQKKLYNEIISQIRSIFHCKYIFFFSFNNYLWKMIKCNLSKNNKTLMIIMELAEIILPEIEKSRKILTLDDIIRIYPEKNIKPFKKFYSFITNLSFLPIIIKNNLHGVILLINSKSERNTEDIHSYVLKTLTNHISISLNNILMTDEKIKNKELLAIGRTVTMIIHDMRNPIHVIKGYIQLMEMDNDFDNPEYFSEISQEVIRISNMMDELSEFVKKGSSKINLIKGNLDSIIKIYINKIKSEFLKNRITIKSNLKLNITCLIDKEKFHRILQNIMNNAGTAMKKSGEIIISTKKLKHFAEISITDNGPGMDENVKKNIFEPFFSNRNSNGLGLGMYIVNQMVLQHRGTIDVESKKNHGTTFIIRLPLKEQ